MYELLKTDKWLGIKERFISSVKLEGYNESEDLESDDDDFDDDDDESLDDDDEDESDDYDEDDVDD